MSVGWKTKRLLSFFLFLLFFVAAFLAYHQYHGAENYDRRTGPSPLKVMSYTLSPIARYTKNESWLPIEMKPNWSLREYEGSINIPDNNITVYIGVFIFPGRDNCTACIKEFERLNDAFTLQGYSRSYIPRDILMRKIHGRILNATILQKDDDAYYIECAYVMGYGRLIILKGKPEELEKLVPILSGND